jgi:hypothetical protein
MPATAEKWKTLIAEENPKALFFDDLDEALIGMARRCGQPTLAVYDYDKIIETRMKQGMPCDEAEEFTSFNTEGAWMGKHTPIIVYLNTHDPEDEI